jgi:cysteine desulfurase
MIYADNAATTKISAIAFKNMIAFLKEQYGNPSSQHLIGQKAKQVIEKARRQIAKAINAKPSEIIFTSGGSESNSWVVNSIADMFKDKSIHLITSSIEHHSVLNAYKKLERNGILVSYLKVDANGYVRIEELKKHLRPNTKFVSIMFANNEIGTIQPIYQIAKFLRARKILFHTDAVQAVGHVELDVEKLQMDFLSASAHKFNGAKGTGFLYIRDNFKLGPLVFGGKQENAMRGGTENVAGITACGFALEENAATLDETAKKLLGLVDITITGLKKAIDGIQINAENAVRLPGILNITFPDASGETMMHLLDLKGICVSTSSACNSSKTSLSHVLLALGLSKKQAKSSIRISYGKYNTERDAKRIIKAVVECYEKIQKSQRRLEHLSQSS